MKIERMLTALYPVQCYRRPIKLEFRPLEVRPGSSSWSADGNERLFVLTQRSEELLRGFGCLTAQWADEELPLSAVSDLGSQSRVLLANGLVVLQDPLQVGHRLVPILTLNLRRGRIRIERKEIKNKMESNKIFIA